ncbi:MAG: Crp/Fnr family transcriptional regulator [Myxococcaceae bacterium]|nr:Crp/Fnr family transcriptional regulator [Myxococcaceae bacterium]
MPPATNPFVWTLPAPLVEALEPHGARRSFAAGAVVHAAGSRSTAIFQVRAGRVRLERVTASGRPLTLTLLYPGSWFGDLGCLVDRPRTDDAIAETAVEVRQVSRETFERVLERRPALMRALLAELAGRLLLVLERFEEANVTELPARMAARLLAMQAVHDQHEAPGSALPLTQQRLADMVGVTRENAARVLAQWRRRGWVRSQRGSLTVIAPKALAALARSG